MSNPLSRHQYGTLRFIKSNVVHESHLRGYKDSTIYPLFKTRQYLYSNGAGEDPVIELTKAGKEALLMYEMATVPERKMEADLTDRTRSLLNLVRRRKARQIHAA